MITATVCSVIVALFISAMIIMQDKHSEILGAEKRAHLKDKIDAYHDGFHDGCKFNQIKRREAISKALAGRILCKVVESDTDVYTKAMMHEIIKRELDDYLEGIEEADVEAKKA